MEQDQINHPTHYCQGSMEVIDAIEGLGLSFHEGNVVKYVARWRFKGGVNDLRKAAWYLNRLIQCAEAERSPDDGKWEAVLDDDGLMCRVRWSKPDEKGRFLWVRHYPTEDHPGQRMAERQAEEWNKIGRRPWEFRHANGVVQDAAGS